MSYGKAISGDLARERPSLRDYPIPEADGAREAGEGLYNSERDYIDQIAEYKAFQGKG